MLEADQGRLGVRRRGSESQSGRVEVVERLLPGPERGQRVVVDDEQYGKGKAQRGREGGLVAQSLERKVNQVYKVTHQGGKDIPST